MHVHMHVEFEMQKRTSFGQPLRAAERPATAAVGAAAHPRTHVVEPQPLAATGGSLGSSVWVGVGGERVHSCGAAALTSVLRCHCNSLYTCWDAVSGRGRARDGVAVKPVQRGGCPNELVSVSKR